MRAPRSSTPCRGRCVLFARIHIASVYQGHGTRVHGVRAGVSSIVTFVSLLGCSLRPGTREHVAAKEPAPLRRKPPTMSAARLLLERSDSATVVRFNDPANKNGWTTAWSTSCTRARRRRPERHPRIPRQRRRLFGRPAAFAGRSSGWSRRRRARAQRVGQAEPADRAVARTDGRLHPRLRQRRGARALAAHGYCRGGARHALQFSRDYL